jgi:hypothetical protein
MADMDSLSAAVAGLDLKISAIGSDIRAARIEVEQTKRIAEQTLREQERLNQQVAATRQQLSQLQSEQNAQRIELLKRLDHLGTELSANTVILQRQQGQLGELIAAQKEEAARRHLEHEKASFVIGLAALLDVIDDRVVLFLFATEALDACKSRDITPHAFMGAADQQTISATLRAFESALQSVSEGDRAEAIRFRKLRALRSDIEERWANYRSSFHKDDLERAAYVSQLERHRIAISELENPEEHNAARARQRRCTGAAVLGILFAVLGAATGGALDPQLAFIALLSLPAFIVWWLNSDAYRRQRLKKHKRALGDVNAAFEKLAGISADRLPQIRDDCSRLQARFADVNLPAPKSEETQDPMSALDILLNAIRQADATWRQQHADVRLLLAN